MFLLEDVLSTLAFPCSAGIELAGAFPELGGDGNCSVGLGLAEVFPELGEDGARDGNCSVGLGIVETFPELDGDGTLVGNFSVGLGLVEVFPELDGDGVKVGDCSVGIGLSEVFPELDGDGVKAGDCSVGLVIAEAFPEMDGGGTFIGNCSVVFPELNREGALLKLRLFGEASKGDRLASLSVFEAAVGVTSDKAGDILFSGFVSSGIDPGASFTPFKVAAVEDATFGEKVLVFASFGEAAALVGVDGLELDKALGEVTRAGEAATSRVPSAIVSSWFVPGHANISER